MTDFDGNAFRTGFRMARENKRMTCAEAAARAERDFLLKSAITNLDRLNDRYDVLLDQLDAITNGGSKP